MFTLTARPRRPRSDGQETRAAILHAAGQLFVEHGYEHATVRAIAERAGCNPSLISRYFGGKSELFATILRWESIREAGKNALIDEPVRSWGHALLRFQMRMTSQFSREDLHDQLVMLLRSASTDSGARRLNEFLGREHAALIPPLTGPDAALRTMLVQALLVGLTVVRDIARLPALRAADAETVVAYLGPTVQELLHGP